MSKLKCENELTDFLDRIKMEITLFKQFNYNKPKSILINANQLHLLRMSTSYELRYNDEAFLGNYLYGLEIFTSDNNSNAFVRIV